ncbi:MAG: hypothetical protein KDJ12_01870, partial [Hyphomicrobiales bacterium]|nr:hypothetical protein [Hyphomicrobiales bacterium]
QGGNNNAYAQYNETIWLGWPTTDGRLAEFVAGLARFRADNALLTENRFLTGRTENGALCADAKWLRADGTAMADADWSHTDFVALTRAPARGGGARMHMAFNRSEVVVGMTLPAPCAGMCWALAIDSIAGFVGRAAVDGDRVTVAARCAVAFVETPRD